MLYDHISQQFNKSKLLTHKLKLIRMLNFLEIKIMCIVNIFTFFLSLAYSDRLLANSVCGA